MTRSPVVPTFRPQLPENLALRSLQGASCESRANISALLMRAVPAIDSDPVFERFGAGAEEQSFGKSAIQGKDRDFQTAVRTKVNRRFEELVIALRIAEAGEAHDLLFIFIESIAKELRNQ